MSVERQVSLDTLLHIKEVEEYYQTLSAEVDGRSLNLSRQLPPPSQAITPEELRALNRDYHDSIYGVRSTWSWLLQASRCMHIHLNNAAQYHQFFHETQLYDQGMRLLFASVRRQSRDPNQDGGREVQQVTAEIRDVIRQLLEYQVRLEVLWEQASEIVPLPLRKAPVTTPVRIKALASYKDKELSVSENEDSLLLDNSEDLNLKWKVRTSGGKEGFLPAIIFLIPPPDRQVIQASYKSRQQLLAVWLDTLVFVKLRALNYFTGHLHSNSAAPLAILTPGQRSEVTESLERMMSLLITPSSEEKGEELRQGVETWRDDLGHMTGTKKDTRGILNKLQLQWSGNSKLLKQIEEFEAYARTYNDELESTRHARHLCLTDGDGFPKYTSKAYVERLKPYDVVPARHMTLTERQTDHLDATDAAGLSAAGHVTEETVEETYVEDEYCEQTVKETQTFVIKGVHDPRSESTISIYEAIADGIISQTQGLYRNPVTGTSMPIPEAMNQGLILVEFTNRSVEAGELIRRGIITVATNIETVTYSVQSVLDPETGRSISIQEAIERGIIDQNSGKYINRKTGETCSLSDAVEKGYLKVEVRNRKPRASEAPPTGYVEEAYVVNGVLDPRVGREISLDKACRQGLIDRDQGIYVYPITNKHIELGIAIQRGLLKARVADPIADASNPNLIIARVWKGPKRFEPKDFNRTIYDKLKDTLPLTTGGITEQTTGQRLTVEEAFNSGVLNFSPLHIQNKKGDKFSIPEAAFLDLLDPHTARVLFRALEPHSLAALIEQKILDPKTGEYFDKETKTRMSLAVAIDNGFLDADKVFYQEVSSRGIMSLGAAVEGKKWDAETGLITDPVSGKEMTLAEAIANRVIEPCIYSDKLADQICALSSLKKHLDTKRKGIKHPVTGEKISIEDAILEGILDVTNLQYVNIDDEMHATTSIPDAVANGHIDEDVAKELLKALGKLTLGQVLDAKLIDPNTGKYIHPETKRRMTIKEAIDQGFLQPSVIFFEDVANDRIASLQTFIDDGRFNPSYGKFRDPLTGLEVTITNAIKKDVIRADFDPEDFLSGKKTVSDLLKAGKIDANRTRLITPNGEEVPVRAALEDGLISPESLVKLDKQNDTITLADPALGSALQALMATKVQLDWIDGVEGEIAKLGTPAEDRADMEAQLELYERLRDDLESGAPHAQRIADDSQALLESRDSAGLSRDRGAVQQLQRLKMNTQDLKMRLQSATEQVDSRLDRLNQTHEEMLQFMSEATDLVQWSKDALGDLDRVKEDVAEVDDLQQITENFQHFNDGVLSKEDYLNSLVKAGANVRDQLQDIGKSAEAYRIQLPGKPPAPILYDAPSEIDAQLADCRESYRQLVGESAAVMGTLSATPEQQRAFLEARDALNGAMSALEARVEHCAVNPDPSKDLTGDLEKLKAMTADLISQGRVLQDMKQSGDELLGALSALGVGDCPKAEDIRATVAQSEGRFDRLQESVVEKQHTLNDALVASQDAQQQVDSLLAWLSDTEDVFSNLRPVSVDRDILSQQVQAHRVVSSDIDNHRVQIDAVAESAQNNPSLEEGAAEMLDRYDNLLTLAQKRGEDLNEVVERLGAVNSSVAQLEGWLAQSVASLKREGVEFDPTALKEKIEKLYQTKAGKQKDLDHIKAMGKELLNDPHTVDKNQLRETIANVQAKWHDLTELLVQMVSFAALREIDELLKYLDKAENEINMADPVSTDPETLAVQLRDHQVFHQDLEQKRSAVNETIDKCNRMLRETTNEEAADIKTKLDTIRSQADLVLKLSTERLSLLEEALPLASHFSETHADLQAWLGEIDAEIQSLDVPPEATAEQIRKQQENAKTTVRIMEDHKPLVDDLRTTGQELMEMCGEDDASDVREDMDAVRAKYDEVRAVLRAKVQILDVAFRNVTSEAGDAVDGLLEELHYLDDQVEHADPVAANPEAIAEQIVDNNTVLDDLERKQGAVAKAREAVQIVLDQENPETREECEDLRCKLQDVDALVEQVREKARQRGDNLSRAQQVAEKFANDYQDAIRALRDIQDNLNSQDSPGVDVATIEEQQRELQAIRDELGEVRQPIEAAQASCGALVDVCGVPGKMEVQKHMEDLAGALEDIEDGLQERTEELTNAREKADGFHRVLHSILSWLPQAEQKLSNLSPIASDPRTVRIQIEEAKVMKVQVHPHFVEIQSLNQHASELKNASPVTAESLSPQVKDINERWNAVLKAIYDRERELKESLVTLGEIDHALDDVLGFLQQVECDLQQLDYAYGDPKYIETHLKKLSLVQRDLKNQENNVKNLNKAVDEIVNKAEPGAAKPFEEKQFEMNDMLRTLTVLARDKQNELNDTLKEVKAFMGNVEDVLRWMNDFRVELKHSAPMGALPDTAQEQMNKFLDKYGMLQRKEEEVQALLLNGEDMLSRSREQDAVHLREDLKKLATKTRDTRLKADRRKVKLDEHLTNVRDFHAMLKIHTDWLNNAEKILGSFKFPSKLVDRVSKQIAEHKAFREDIDAHREIMTNLDRTGTYLKYFGRKQDTVYIKNLLISIKLRWKKLVRRAEEKGRLLQQANKEDKRFHNAWSGLCEWLEESERKLKRYTTATPGKVAKEQIEELRLFQHTLSARHPQYYSTMRLGRSLKDRCTKNDTEREVLNGMLEQLKNKWNIVRSIVAQRQNKLDEALVSSGRISDALASLLEWLNKAESYLGEDQPILGDLDTVNILIEQHRAFQSELESRRQMVEGMRANESPELEGAVASQLEELGTVWERVNQLSLVREARLTDAVKLAEEFNEAVQTVRDWLPQVEAELKFKPLPDDELSIVQLMEAHEAFEEELRSQQPNIEKIRYLAEEILQACHPNAVRFVRYYLTITHTRWEQALQRAEQRAQRLHEALQGVRSNAQLVEELLAWLTEAQALLSTKERDTIPEDITVVDALVKEHLEFHDELSERNKHVDKVAALGGSPSGKEKRSSLHGSNYDLSRTEDRPSPRVASLQNRWRTVWRMSVDRKKKLQDVLDHLLELESFKNFDFELWRQRYVAWIRAKKFRITDFFRKQDKDGDGVLSRTEFIDGMISSNFPTNRTELNAVFDVFDKNGSGELDYKEFMAALKPDRQAARRMAGTNQPMTDSQAIHDEIEQQVSHCQCRSQFKVQKMAEGKYRMGEKGKLCLVRFLNSTVMVRVGGGWQRLDEFLESNDPCKAKGRTNFDVRDALGGPAGDASNLSPLAGTQGRALFTPKSRRSSTPNQHTNGRLNTSSNSSSPTALNPKLSSSTASLISTGARRGSGADTSLSTVNGRKTASMTRSMHNLASASTSSLSTSRRSSLASNPGSRIALLSRTSSTTSTPRTPRTPSLNQSLTDSTSAPCSPALSTKPRLDQSRSSLSSTGGSRTAFSRPSSTVSSPRRPKSASTISSARSNPKHRNVFDFDSFSPPQSPRSLLMGEPGEVFQGASTNKMGRPHSAFTDSSARTDALNNNNNTTRGTSFNKGLNPCAKGSQSNLNATTPTRGTGNVAFGSSTPARRGPRKSDHGPVNGRATPSNGRTTPSGRTTPHGDRAKTPAGGVRGSTPRNAKTATSSLNNKPMRFT